MEYRDFTFQASWKAGLDGLPDARRLELYDAIAEYGTTGMLSNLALAFDADFVKIKDNIDKEQKEKTKGKRKKEPKKEKDQKEKTSSSTAADAKELINYFNNKMEAANAKIPHSVNLTPKRKAAINARAKEYGSESLKKMVDKAAESKFLNGIGNVGFTATIDWLLKPNNYPKVIEGNYDNDKLNFNFKNKTNNYGNQQQTQDRRRGAEAVHHTVEEYEEDF